MNRPLSAARVAYPVSNTLAGHFLLLFLAAAVTVFSARPAAAHDPALHGFNLVPFKKPFAAPPVELPVLAGGKAALQSYRGKIVVLNFWATWCPPCIEEMPSLQALADRYDDETFEVIAIASDEEGASIVQPFIDKLGVSFPIWLDADSAVSKVYGAKNLPVTFVLDKEGQVIAAATGNRDWASEEAFSVFDEIVNAQ